MRGVSGTPECGWHFVAGGGAERDGTVPPVAAVALGLPWDCSGIAHGAGNAVAMVLICVDLAIPGTRPKLV